MEIEKKNEQALTTKEGPLFDFKTFLHKLLPLVYNLKVWKKKLSMHLKIAQPLPSSKSNGPSLKQAFHQ